jgi:hypothetical protein
MLIFCLTTTSCNYSSNNKIVKSIESSNNDYVAYLFIRDLGATTKASYQLSILKKGKNLGDEGGNIFISYGEFDIEWSSQNELIVKIVGKGEIFKQASNFKGINIKYLTQ